MPSLPTRCPKLSDESGFLNPQIGHRTIYSLGLTWELVRNVGLGRSLDLLNQSLHSHNPPCDLCVCKVRFYTIFMEYSWTSLPTCVIWGKSGHIFKTQFSHLWNEEIKSSTGGSVIERANSRVKLPTHLWVKWVNLSQPQSTKIAILSTLLIGLL